MTAVVLNFKSHLADLFAQALRVVAPEAGQTDILIERPKQVMHGDYACNLAMQLAKPLRKPPRDIAQALIAALPASDVVEKVEIAGGGLWPRPSRRGAPCGSGVRFRESDRAAACGAWPRCGGG